MTQGSEFQAGQRVWLLTSTISRLPVLVNFEYSRRPAPLFRGSVGSLTAMITPVVEREFASDGLSLVNVPTVVSPGDLFEDWDAAMLQRDARCRAATMGVAPEADLEPAQDAGHALVASGLPPKNLKAAAYSDRASSEWTSGEAAWLLMQEVSRPPILVSIGEGDILPGEMTWVEPVWFCSTGALSDGSDPGCLQSAVPDRDLFVDYDAAIRAQQVRCHAAVRAVVLPPTGQGGGGAP